MNQEFEIIRNLYNHRLALNPGDSPTKETPEFWNNSADALSAKMHSSEARAEVEKFLDLFHWEKGETVLDVAAGPGSYSIPLAHRNCLVTATDFSPRMLQLLQNQANKEKVRNIECLSGRWLEMNLDKQYDTVLCMNSLGVISTDSEHNAHLDLSLDKLFKATGKRLIMMIPHADSPLDNHMKRILGLPEVSIERRRIALIYYAMVDRGMLPSVKIIDGTGEWVFDNLDDFCRTIIKKSGRSQQISDDTYCQLREYLAKVSTSNSNGKVTLTYNLPKALFTVNKQNLIK